MTDIQQTDKKNTLKPLTAGFAVGAALGAAAVALTDKKNQNKIKHALKKVREWAGEASESFTATSEDMIDEVQQKAKKTSEKPKRKTSNHQTTRTTVN